MLDRIELSVFCVSGPIHGISPKVGAHKFTQGTALNHHKTEIGGISRSEVLNARVISPKDLEA